jgi:hypothetical protein
MSFTLPTGHDQTADHERMRRQRGMGPWLDLRVVAADIHDFFMASAGAAAALIGLLFVAISVAGDRLAGTAAEGQIHRIRANAALISFNNSLAVSLFALVPGKKIGWTCVVVSSVGMVFVVASLVSLVRVGVRRWSTGRDALFLVGLAVVFVFQFTSGLDVVDFPYDEGAVRTVAILVIVCFLIGIGRAWDLIGGPSIHLRAEVAAMVREHVAAADAPDEPAEARETAEVPRAAEASGPTEPPASAPE